MNDPSPPRPRPLLLDSLVLVLVAAALGTLAAGAAPAAGEREGASGGALAGSALLAPSSSGAPGEDPLARSCPCSGPATFGVWRDHGRYVSCVTRAARAQARTTALTPSAARGAIRAGARSSCGEKGSGHGTVRVCGSNPVLPCPTVRTARVEDCAECAAALAGKLVRCARVATSAGDERDVCGERSLAGAHALTVLETRTGVDCSSCKAKLGTPQGPGLDCLVASCASPLP